MKKIFVTFTSIGLTWNLFFILPAWSQTPEGKVDQTIIPKLEELRQKLIETETKSLQALKQENPAEKAKQDVDVLFEPFSNAVKVFVQVQKPLEVTVPGLEGDYSRDPFMKSMVETAYSWSTQSNFLSNKAIYAGRIITALKPLIGLVNIDGRKALCTFSFPLFDLNPDRCETLFNSTPEKK